VHIRNYESFSLGLQAYKTLSERDYVNLSFDMVDRLEQELAQLLNILGSLPGIEVRPNFSPAAGDEVSCARFIALLRALLRLVPVISVKLRDVDIEVNHVARSVRFMKSTDLGHLSLYLIVQGRLGIAKKVCLLPNARYEELVRRVAEEYLRTWLGEERQVYAKYVFAPAYVDFKLTQGFSLKPPDRPFVHAVPGDALDVREVIEQLREHVAKHVAEAVKKRISDLLEVTRNLYKTYKEEYERLVSRLRK